MTTVLQLLPARAALSLVNMATILAQNGSLALNAATVLSSANALASQVIVVHQS